MCPYQSGNTGLLFSTMGQIMKEKDGKWTVLNKDAFTLTALKCY